MQPGPDPSEAGVRVDVTASDWACVQRIVVLLTGRGYVVSSLEARPSTSGSGWQVRIDLCCAPSPLSLLHTRLERIPCVTAVVTSAATAPCDPLATPLHAGS